MAGFLIGLAGATLFNQANKPKAAPGDEQFDVVETKTTVKKRKFKRKKLQEKKSWGGDFSNVGY